MSLRISCCLSKAEKLIGAFFLLEPVAAVTGCCIQYSQLSRKFEGVFRFTPPAVLSLLPCFSTIDMAESPVLKPPLADCSLLRLAD
ncbi:hypothetical protein FGO68_gene2524 [Halteria grandinella]|uniref:Secreted protein n=1 Tax=Halteria grandinella TaxID=5974 RepID=A0A8J8P6R0_HALGN|nr:hypothetical protein FGO68_gene2524 [Halteria grandinella]